jgi:hypothetical protein
MSRHTPESTTDFSVQKVLLSLLPICLVMVGCAGHTRPSPGDGTPISFTTQPLPIQQPIPLSASTFDKFASWLLTMGSEQLDDVKQQIALAAADSSVVDAVSARLSFTNPGSVDHQLLYLSILGQMKNERAIAPLRDYVYSTECSGTTRVIQARRETPETSMLDVCGLLKSHAINMISFINSASAQQVVLQAVSEHSEKAVRISAINAFLYNAGDSAEAIQLVTRYAHPDERIFVGLPRLEPAIDLKEFNDRVARFYRAHPEQLPPPARSEERKQGVLQ